jgi:hypothetical protein
MAEVGTTRLVTEEARHRYMQPLREALQGLDRRRNQTCTPMRVADGLRATGVGRRAFAGTAEAGTRTGRAVGNGDA